VQSTARAAKPLPDYTGASSISFTILHR
jgi:hypothetical protein